MKRWIFLGIWLIPSLSAAALTVTAPTASQVLSATSFTLKVSTSGVSSIYSVEYDIDGEIVGISRNAGYSFIWNTYYVGNGVHSVVAIARDILNNTLATSAAIAFSVENNLPQMTCGTTCTDVSVAVTNIAQLQLNTAVNTANQLISVHGSVPPVLVGNPVIRTGTITSPMAMTSTTTTAGNLLTFFGRWQSATDTISVTDNKGDTFICITPSSSAISNIGVGWCSAKNISGGAGTIVTATTSGGSTFATGFVIEITSADKTSPIDVAVSRSGASTSNILSSTFTLSFTNELILMGASWGGASLIANPGSGYMAYNSSGGDATVETISPININNWFSTMDVGITVNGPNATISKTIASFIDGFSAGNLATSGASGHIQMDSSLFANTTHQVVVRVDGGNCPGCTDGIWSDMGGWEQSLVFNNPVLPSALLTNAREVILSSGGAPVTMSGIVLNTDGSTTTATITSCVPNSSTYFTITSTCTITPTSSPGIDFVTMTDSNGFTRVFWPFVLGVGQNAIPNFGSDGSLQSNYQPNSVWHSSMFYTGTPFAPVNGGGSGVTSKVNLATQFGPGFAQAGYNTVEYDIELYGSSQATFQADIGIDTSTIMGNLNTYGQGVLKYVHLIGDSWARTTPALFATIYGASAAWSPQALTDALQRWSATNAVIGDDFLDEVPWGGNPLEGTDTGGIIMGTNGFTQITGDGTTCSLSWTSPNDQAFTGARTFIITGSSTTALDYNPTTNSPRFQYTTLIGSSVTFPCAYTGTISSGTAEIHSYFFNAFDASGVGCTPGGGSAGPCTQWIHYDALKQLRQMISSATGANKASFPLANGCCGFGISNWSGAKLVGGTKMGDYWTTYWTPGGQYLPDKISMSVLPSSLGDTIRNNLNYMDRTTPLLAESAGTMTDYLFQGAPYSVVSCSGNVITTSLPHGISNVIPEMTKLWVVGSTGTCDGNYYVIATPTANTLTVALAIPTVTQGGNGGTVTFQDGNAYSMTSVAIDNDQDNLANLMTPVSGNCTWKGERGQTFLITGTSSATVNGMTGWFDPAMTLDNPCGGSGPGGQSYWRQVPVLSATGGTAYIVPDLWYRRGLSWNVNSDVGPRFMFGSVNELAIEGAAGDRTYSFQGDPQYSDRTIIGLGNQFASGQNLAFNPKDFNAPGAVQVGLNPVVDYGRTQESTMGHTYPNILHRRFIKYEFQSRLNSPDYGKGFEAAARSGPFGNILMIQSILDGKVSCTANLSPYLVAGQPIIRYSATWGSIDPIKVLAAGTTTDTMVCDEGQFRAYVFANNEAAELLEPTISTKLSSVANAASIKVQYAYTPMVFNSSSVSGQVLYTTFDCGNGAQCQIPVDKNLGAVYYRLLYLDAGGNILSTSDVQKI